MTYVYPLRKLKNGNHLIQMAIEPQYMEAAADAMKNCWQPSAEFFTCLFQKALDDELARVRKNRAGREATINREIDILMDEQRAGE